MRLLARHFDGVRGDVAARDTPWEEPRIMKGRPFEGMVGLVVLATKLTAQRSTL